MEIRRDEMESQDFLGKVKNAGCSNLKSFNGLILMYQDIVYDVAYRMLSDHQASEIATQKAFLSAYRSLSTYRVGSFRIWLLRILIQVCHIELRYHKSHSFTSLINRYFAGTEELKLPDKVSNPGRSNESTPDCPDLNIKVQHLLACLPPNDRAILILVDVWGMEYAEVAEITGRPISTIRKRLALARKSIHDLLVVG